MYYLHTFTVTRRGTGQGGGHTVYYLYTFVVTRRVTGQGGGHTVYYLQEFAVTRRVTGQGGHTLLLTRVCGHTPKAQLRKPPGAENELRAGVLTASAHTYESVITLCVASL